MERMAEQNPLPASGSLETTAARLAGHGRVALATVIATWGSSPVPVGGQMVVAPDETFAGSVSGGCVEADVIAEAADVLADGDARTLEFGVADETAWAAGLPCGGSIRVHVERLTRERDGATLDRLVAARRVRRPVSLVTSLDGGGREVIEMSETAPPELAEAVATLGSRRNHARRVALLAAAGLSPGDIARIRAPIGLDIGACTPPEIALSIMAEVVQAFRGAGHQEASR